MERLLRYLTKIPPGTVVGVIALIALFLMSGSPTASNRVPELEGLQVNPAIAKAAKEGYFTKVVFERTGGVAGTVVRQSPDELTLHDKHTTITLHVTEGAPQIKVPALRGIEVDEARRRIDRHNLTPGAVTYQEDDKVKSDHVIETIPRAQTSVDVGTKIDIIAAD